jgi:hypothetical protein
MFREDTFQCPTPCGKMAPVGAFRAHSHRSYKLSLESKIAKNLKQFWMRKSSFKGVQGRDARAFALEQLGPRAVSREVVGREMY